MRLTDKAIAAIDNQNVRLLLALALGFTEQWIIVLIKKEPDASNSPLTTAAALKVIRQNTNLKKDSEILEETKTTSVAIAT